ncbi:MAG TPA: bacteriocin [Polyangia bacterium]|nr:bacteriocin [Polyangia bacterium]
MSKTKTSEKQQRIFSRQAAKEVTKAELQEVTGGLGGGSVSRCMDNEGFVFYDDSDVY